MGPCKDHGRTKSLRPEGYAMVGIPGMRSRCTNLHRLVYCEYNQCSLESIKGQCIRHRCDNPRCTEPTHLEIGTRADNNADRAQRGRSATVVPSRQRLGPAQVAAILSRYSPDRVGIKAPNGVTQLAKDFGVDSKVIYRVLRGTYQCTRSS